jgi:hypothetical protein
MADVIRLKVEGDQIKSARKPGGQHRPVLRIFLPGQIEQRDWGGFVSGGAELCVFRSNVEEFEIHILRGRFEPGSPQPVFTEAKPWKHVYSKASGTNVSMHWLPAAMETHGIITT